MPEQDATLPLESGVRTFARLVPEGREDLPTPEFVGGTASAGASYLFLFPFDIYTSVDLTEPIETTVDGTQVRVYPPFLSEPSQSVRLPGLELARVPSLPGTVPVNHNRVSIREFTMDRRFGLRCDAIRMDVCPDREADFADRLGGRILGLMRWWTMQWWVGRGRSATTGYLRHSFPINQRGERLDGVHFYASEYGPLGFERTLTPELFRGVRANLLWGRSVPLHIDLFCDAVFHHSVGDIARCVIDLARGCEAALDHRLDGDVQAGTMAQTQVDRILQGNDFIAHLRRAGELYGGGFSTAHSAEEELLWRLWIARGHVAHGAEAVAPVARGQAARLIELRDLIQIIRAVLAYYGWLERVRVI